MEGFNEKNWLIGRIKRCLNLASCPDKSVYIYVYICQMEWYLYVVNRFE